MAKRGITNIGGGGGIGSDELTVTKDYVLSGLEYVGADTDDEKGVGVMINNGTTANQNLNASGSFLVKGGYHAQPFTVNANSLASQTVATATNNKVLNGETFYANGVMGIGNVIIQSILSFSAAVYSSTAITFTWKNPAKGPFSGVIIVGKTGSYPTSITDGTRYYKGTGNNTTANGTSSTTVSSFASGTTYYFRAFSYAVKDGAEWISTTTYTATASTTKGQEVITSSGTFTIPAGVRSVDIFVVGGGGAGASGNVLPTGSDSVPNYNSSAGGGGGYTTTLKGVTVSPGEILTITIGAGGIAPVNSVFGSNGGTTSVTRSGTTLVSANGGEGSYSSLNRFTPGGSSGGRHLLFDNRSGLDPGERIKQMPSAGNSDGAGTNSQGATTRAFGESNTTIYSGGGGAGGMNAYNTGLYVLGTAGGSSGGGVGAGSPQAGGYNPATAGIAGTGGGGGGGALNRSNQANRDGKNGGSGVCIIRWGY